MAMPSLDRLAAALLLISFSAHSYSAACTESNALSLKASVVPDHATRSTAAPREIFGFNLPWRDFQTSYSPDGVVRDDLVKLLRPFAGAVYRYPGGSPSNSFDWALASGPVKQRPKQHSDFGRFAQVQFGLEEFSEFVKLVDGRAILTLNLLGPYKELWSLDELRTQAHAFGKLVSENKVFSCTDSLNCSLMAVELGNEVDWGPFNMTSTEYIERAKAVQKEINAQLPKVSWIANGLTAPWESKSDSAKLFNRDVANGLAATVGGVSIHPYYDGIPVPMALDFVRAYGKTWSAERPEAKVYVTEHARWPSQPAKGRWEDNWYQANGLGGAVSAADFMLGLMQIPAVSAANWHALATGGPWQLIPVDKATNALLPSPVYWGMRVMREAYLDRFVEVNYAPTNTANYSGKYDQRLVAMKSENGAKLSLLGVNRSATALSLVIDWGEARRSEGNAQLRWIWGDSDKADNTAAEPQTVTLLTSSQPALAGRHDSVWCIPPRSVFSVVDP